ncbi:unnamed protein product [Ambrosiozyma monospora]|uniref:Unnamed protein product n=1 Tax=Ambrosiozyma monospora TaxID=43982 RepID=A0ACB5T3R0_AMBMO|nr:unnamed protein product [Ambrosiozyma monospora]
MAETKTVKKSYKDLIIGAIQTLKERNGSSRQAVKKYIQANADVNGSNFDGQFNLAIKRGVAAGYFIQPKGPSGPIKLDKSHKTFVDATKAKKAAAKKAAAPKKAPKKAVGTKPAAAKKAAPKKAATATKKTTTTKAAPKKAAPKKAAATKKTTKAAPKKKATASKKK